MLTQKNLKWNTFTSNLTAVLDKVHVGGVTVCMSGAKLR